MSYEAWRISYQSSEQAARAAYSGLQSTSTRLHEAAVACANAEAERDALRAELDNIKQVEFQRRVEKVAEGWRGKCDRLEKERAELLEALKSIEDYWNQDQNETAMADACWHAINTARAAIARATGEQP